MISYLKNMKIKYPSLGQEKRSSMDSAESGCKWNHRITKKPFPYSNCLIIALPIVSFLALGIYFILVDLKILASVLNSTSNGTSNSSFAWSVRPADVEPESDVVVILEEDNRTEWLLQPEERTTTTTTQKAFVYSPTVPHVTRPEQKAEATTREQESAEGANCFSPRIAFCEGILPYDLVQLPQALNASQVEALAPRFHRLFASNCSSRAREVVCAVLEPECQPNDGRQLFPCVTNCRAVADQCRDAIAGDPALSELFTCEGPWGEAPNCVDLLGGGCAADEHRCPSGGCIPTGWLCNGRDDCGDGGSDEDGCPPCSRGFFSCAADGTCIPSELVCDGETNCPDNSDETSC